MALPSRTSDSPEGGEDQAAKDRVGLRPAKIWIPDVTSAAFLDEARRQSLAVATSPYAEEDQAFIDALSNWEDE